MSQTDLYFIGVLPSEPVLSDVRKFKEVCQERFGSGRALRSPAHITLVPPFRAAPEALAEIAQSLKEIASGHSPFTSSTDHFGRFDQKVIFVKPFWSDQLNALYHQCNERLNALGYTKLSTRSFHPHMTIAFRDLTPENFAVAWPYFSNLSYVQTYNVDALSLLINGKEGWTVVNTFPLGD